MAEPREIHLHLTAQPGTTVHVTIAGEDITVASNDAEPAPSKALARSEEDVLETAIQRLESSAPARTSVKPSTACSPWDTRSSWPRPAPAGNPRTTCASSTPSTPRTASATSPRDLLLQPHLRPGPPEGHARRIDSQQRSQLLPRGQRAARPRRRQAAQSLTTQSNAPGAAPSPPATPPRPFSIASKHIRVTDPHQLRCCSSISRTPATRPKPCGAASEHRVPPAGQT